MSDSANAAKSDAPLPRSRRWQFDLKTLLATFFLVAVLATPAAYFGVWGLAFWVPVFALLAVAWLVVWAARFTVVR